MNYVANILNINFISKQMRCTIGESKGCLKCKTFCFKENLGLQLAVP